ncbi:MAG: XRE family transcriptional regulator [Oxalobacteraceae bacterium]|nr:MAG: XRE family transcriptional regulator [Oxalobacteraceae bacterium]
MTYARKNSSDIQFGKTLSAVRQQRGFSGVELARAIGAHPVTISRWQMGASKCSMKDRVRLSEVLLTPLQHAHIVPEESPALANALRRRQELMDEITALQHELDRAEHDFQKAQAAVNQHA